MAFGIDPFFHPNDDNDTHQLSIYENIKKCKYRIPNNTNAVSFIQLDKTIYF